MLVTLIELCCFSYLVKRSLPFKGKKKVSLLWGSNCKTTYLLNKDLFFQNKVLLFLQGEGWVFSNNPLCLLNIEIFNLVKLVGKFLLYKHKFFPPQKHEYLLQSSPPPNKTYDMRRF